MKTKYPFTIFCFEIIASRLLKIYKPAAVDNPFVSRSLHTIKSICMRMLSVGETYLILIKTEQQSNYFDFSITGLRIFLFAT